MKGTLKKVRGLHHTYQFINIQSAVAADWVWFNSSYHRDVFIQPQSSSSNACRIAKRGIR